MKAKLMTAGCNPADAALIEQHATAAGLSLPQLFALLLALLKAGPLVLPAFQAILADVAAKNWGQAVVDVQKLLAILQGLATPTP